MHKKPGRTDGRTDGLRVYNVPSFFERLKGQGNNNKHTKEMAFQRIFIQEQ